jgi:hypothetical protein
MIMEKRRGKLNLENPRITWENSIKTKVREICCEDER